MTITPLAGGSIRIPAHFCGIVGFKPTPQRISVSGVTDLHSVLKHLQARGLAVPRPNNESGQNAVFGVAGPMVDALV